VFTNNELTFTDGCLVANNPTAVGMAEAKALWPNKPIDLVVSCGTGKPPSKVVKPPSSVSDFLPILITCCGETSKTDSAISCILPSDVYYRFQPFGSDIFGVDLDETDAEKLNLLSAATSQFIEDNLDRIKELAASLTKN